MQSEWSNFIAKDTCIHVAHSCKIQNSLDNHNSDFHPLRRWKIFTKGCLQGTLHCRHHEQVSLQSSPFSSPLKVDRGKTY